MAIIELSDLYGAIESYISKYNLNMEALKLMSDTTKRAFINGRRTYKIYKLIKKLIFKFNNNYVWNAVYIEKGDLLYLDIVALKELVSEVLDISKGQH